MKFVETHKKTVAVIGSIIAGLASLVTIVSFFSNGDRTPQFSGDLAKLDAARNFAKFLEENDRKKVYLDIECNDTGYSPGGAGIDIESHCSVYQAIQGTKRYTFVLSVGEKTITEYWNSSADDVRYPPIWFLLYIPENTLNRHGNSSKGAGYSRTQGYFFILRTNSGAVPPDAIYYEVTGVRHEGI